MVQIGQEPAIQKFLSFHFLVFQNLNQHLLQNQHELLVIYCVPIYKPCVCAQGFVLILFILMEHVP